MGLPSVFEVFQLAIGPSLAFTTGALRIGQAFREVLLSNSYRSSHRILIELSGSFSRSGRENSSDQAVIAGLGGFTLEEPGLKLKLFYGKIKENGYLSFPTEVWPFNPESDLIFNVSDQDLEHASCIRFYLLSPKGQPVVRTEYYSSPNGYISGAGIPETRPVRSENFASSFREIKSIINAEMITIPEFVISGECSIHHITRDHFQRRMMVTWKLMKANIDRGLKTQMVPSDHPDGDSPLTYKDYLARVSGNPTAGSDNMRASVFARVLAEEILNNRQIITAPTCTGSAILPAVFRFIQEKFMFPDEKMVEALTVSGLFGSLILHSQREPDPLSGIKAEIAFSAMMVSAGVAYLMGGTINEIENAASMAALLYGDSDQQPDQFDSNMLVLTSSMAAQTVPALVDLSKTQHTGNIPGFDQALKSLFRRN